MAKDEMFSFLKDKATSENSDRRKRIPFDGSDCNGLDLNVHQIKLIWKQTFRTFIIILIQKSRTIPINKPRWQQLNEQCLYTLDGWLFATDSGYTLAQRDTNTT